MAKIRNALDKHLGIPEQDYTPPYARRVALIEHVGQALAAQNYAAAQVYAMLLIAEGQDNRIEAKLSNWEDLAIAIAAHMRPSLDGIEWRLIAWKVKQPGEAGAWDDVAAYAPPDV